MHLNITQQQREQTTDTHNNTDETNLCIFNIYFNQNYSIDGNTSSMRKTLFGMTLFF